MQRVDGVEQNILEIADVNTDFKNVNYFLRNLFIGSGTIISEERIAVYSKQVFMKDQLAYCKSQNKCYVTIPISEVRLSKVFS